MNKRRDPSLSGQEYEIELDETSSVLVRVIKSHVNDGYSLVLRDGNTDKPISFEQMCSVIFDEIPVLYTEDDVMEVVGKLFEAEDNVEIDQSISEWDNASEIARIAQIEQMQQVQSEILNGVYSEGHVKTDEALYLRFGDIIAQIQFRWVENG